MKDWQKLSHVKWDCKYHIVFVTKYRKRRIYGKIRQKVGLIIRQLCDQKGILLHEGHAMSDHIHILVSITSQVQCFKYHRFYQSRHRKSRKTDHLLTI